MSFLIYFNTFLIIESNILYTGKSLPKAFLFAEHGENMLCTEIVSDIHYETPCIKNVLKYIKKPISY